MPRPKASFVARFRYTLLACCSYRASDLRPHIHMVYRTPFRYAWRRLGRRPARGAEVNVLADRGCQLRHRGHRDPSRASSLRRAAFELARSQWQGQPTAPSSHPRRTAPTFLPCRREPRRARAAGSPKKDLLRLRQSCPIMGTGTKSAPERIFDPGEPSSTILRRDAESAISSPPKGRRSSRSSSDPREQWRRRWSGSPFELLEMGDRRRASRAFSSFSRTA